MGPLWSSNCQGTRKFCRRNGGSEGRAEGQSGPSLEDDPGCSWQPQTLRVWVSCEDMDINRWRHEELPNFTGYNPFCYGGSISPLDFLPKQTVSFNKEFHGHFRLSIEYLEGIINSFWIASAINPKTPNGFSMLCNTTSIFFFSKRTI